MWEVGGGGTSPIAVESSKVGRAKETGMVPAATSKESDPASLPASGRTLSTAVEEFQGGICASWHGGSNVRVLGGKERSKKSWNQVFPLRN